jgi:restriction system protein
MALSRTAKAGPQFIRYLNPVLKALRELGGSGRLSEVESFIVSDLSISVQEQQEATRGGQSRFSNQISWTKFYLAKAGLVESSAHGVWSLTQTGYATTLARAEALALFKEVHDRWKSSKSEMTDSEEESSDQPPEDNAAPTGGDYREALLDLLKRLPSAGFEKICQRLLRESGFQQVTVTGRSGDGGIDGDGVLQINAFVSFRVLFQCKRYGAAVVPAQVRDFRGAMAGRADKGIILTTGTFTFEARKEAIRDGVPPIELVDGARLVNMFEEYRLGLIPKQTYELDPSFFEEYKQPIGPTADVTMKQDTMITRG